MCFYSFDTASVHLMSFPFLRSPVLRLHAGNRGLFLWTSGGRFGNGPESGHMVRGRGSLGARVPGTQSHVLPSGIVHVARCVGSKALAGAEAQREKEKEEEEERKRESKGVTV